MRFRVLCELGSGCYGLVYLVSLLDEHDQHIAYKALKQSVYWDGGIGTFDMIREINTAHLIYDHSKQLNGKILTIDQIWLGEYYMYEFMEPFDAEFDKLMRVYYHLLNPYENDLDSSNISSSIPTTPNYLSRTLVDSNDEFKTDESRQYSYYGGIDKQVVDNAIFKYIQSDEAPLFDAYICVDHPDYDSVKLFDSKQSALDAHKEGDIWAYHLFLSDKTPRSSLNNVMNNSCSKSEDDIELFDDNDKSDSLSDAPTEPQDYYDEQGRVWRNGFVINSNVWDSGTIIEFTDNKTSLVSDDLLVHYLSDMTVETVKDDDEWWKQYDLSIWNNQKERHREFLVETIKILTPDGFRAFFLECTKQMTGLMVALHDILGLVHEDFRGANIGMNFGKDGKFSLVLFDYSSVKPLHEPFHPYHTVCRKVNMGIELFLGEPVLPTKSDIWALGLAIGELVAPGCGFFPEIDFVFSSDDEFDEEFDEIEDEDEIKLVDNVLTEEETKKIEQLAMNNFECLDEKDNENIDEDDSNYDPDSEQDSDDSESEYVCEAINLTKEHQNWVLDRMQRKGLVIWSDKDHRMLQPNEVPDQDCQPMWLDPTNLDLILEHIQENHDYLKNVPRWLSRWWLQMFYRKPEDRPDANVLLETLKNSMKKYMKRNTLMMGKRGRLQEQSRSQAQSMIAAMKFAESSLVEQEDTPHVLYRSVPKHLEKVLDNIDQSLVNHLQEKHYKGVFEALKIRTQKISLAPNLHVVNHAFHLYNLLIVNHPENDLDWRTIFHMCLTITEKLRYNESHWRSCYNTEKFSNEINYQKFRLMLIEVWGGRFHLHESECAIMIALLCNTLKDGNDPLKNKVYFEELIDVPTWREGVTYDTGAILDEISQFYLLCWWIQPELFESNTTIQKIFQKALQCAISFVSFIKQPKLKPHVFFCPEWIDSIGDLDDERATYLTKWRKQWYVMLLQRTLVSKK